MGTYVVVVVTLNNTQTATLILLEIIPRTSTATLAGSAFVSGSGLSMDAYWTDRWVTASGNNEDGSGSFGRKAQRQVVVQAMKSVVDTSSEIRDEERRNF